MRKLRLTAKRVVRLLEGAPGRYRDDVVSGLVLVVVESKRKRPDAAKPKNTGNWQFRYQLRGGPSCTGKSRKAHDMGLGSVADFSLAEARVRARAARQKLADKIDPLAEKRAAEAAKKLADAKRVTFREAATQFFNKHEKRWRSARSRQQFQNTMATYVNPIIGDLPVDAITTDLVLRVLEPYWLTKTVTMNRTRSRIEQVLAAAAARGLRSSENPARWGHLKHMLPPPAKLAPVVHHSALAYAELPAFMVRLRQCEGVAPQALEFAILTASRTGEVLGAKWSEIDFEQKLWTVPGSRMKGGREHRVPLAAETVALLKGLYTQRTNPYVFISASGGGLSNMALAKALRRLEPDVTVHGFRSTFRDWAAERSNFQPHIVELCLAHSVGNAVEKSYRRGDLFDKRRAVMEAWASYCESSPVEAGEVVVPMRSAAP